MTEPIQHHTVPRFYLSGFADGRRLRAVDKRTGRTFGISAYDATTSRRFYAVPDHPTDVGIVERILGQLEAVAERVISHVVGGQWPLPPAERDLLAVFMTLQFLRGPDQRAQVQQQLTLFFERASPEEIAELAQLDGAPTDFDPTDRGHLATMAAAVHIGQIFQGVPELKAHLVERAWVLVRFDTPSLFTSDAPLTPSVHPNGTAALGVENAQMLVFPLTRTLGVQMNQPGFVALLPGVTERIVAGELDTVVIGDDARRALFNASTVMHAHQRIFHHPDDAALVPRNITTLARLGGRIDLTNPPTGMSPAP